MPPYDVAIVGGGPAGSTAACFLRKHGPDLRVLVLEREAFPRDHVGESGLPGMARLLDEIGAWDKVEAAGFPIKVGATYRWGRNPELWDFDFVAPETLRDLPRPGRYEGPRARTAFQVDRAVYDKILLDHAREMGCEVRESTRVVRVRRAGDRVAGLDLDGGETVEARWVVDASGHSGVVRRAMDVGTTCPTALRNVAIWGYWRDAGWAERIGTGGTRVQVVSLGWGWIWFIPLGPDRTSVGLVVPANRYKASGERPEALYARALGEDARIADLLANARSEGAPQTTKDWSFLADRHAGENWLLAGEASGFADPILAAGMTISQHSGREAAFTILEADRGAPREWLREAYDRRQASRLRSHIRFAEYWYSANAQFTDLQAYTARIAQEAGLDLTPDRAWAWLAQGGFIEDEGAGTAGFSLPLFRDLTGFLGDVRTESPVYRSNAFRLRLEGARRETTAVYAEGRVRPVEAYVRDGSRLPTGWPYSFWLEAIPTHRDIDDLKALLRAHLGALEDPTERGVRYASLMPALDAMILEGWVEATYDPRRPRFNDLTLGSAVHAHEEAPVR